MPHSAGSGKACRCVSAERLASASMRRTASSAHALEPRRSRLFAGRRHVRSFPDPGARLHAGPGPQALARSLAAAASRSAAAWTGLTPWHCAVGLTLLVSRLRQALAALRVAAENADIRRAELAWGAVDRGRVGALRRPRRVRLQPRRIHGGRDRRPRAPAPGGRDRAVRIVPRRPLPARAVPAGRRAPGSGGARRLGRGCPDGRPHHRLRRRVRGRRLLDALPAGSHRAAAIARAHGAGADRRERSDLDDREPRHAARPARRRRARRVRRCRCGLRGQRGGAPGRRPLCSRACRCRAASPRLRSRPGSTSGRASGRSGRFRARGSSSASSPRRRSSAGA